MASGISEEVGGSLRGEANHELRGPQADREGKPALVGWGLWWSEGAREDGWLYQSGEGRPWYGAAVVVRRMAPAEGSRLSLASRRKSSTSMMGSR